MFHFEIDDPNVGLYTVVDHLQSKGIRTESRNGPVIRFPKPVCLEYTNPRRRLLTDAVRDANPFFHFFETLWMFAGMNEIEPLLLYNSGMKQYSDDGRVLKGTAYGHRWRIKWGDQLRKAVDQLKKDPSTRQIVISMWDPFELGMSSKDFACNLQVMFSTRYAGDGFRGNHFLDMTVTNRSNDLIYGAMGSNMFHFSMLHEYIAHHAGLATGSYYQISNNLHAYTDNPTTKRVLENNRAAAPSPDSDSTLSEYALTFDHGAIRRFVEGLDRSAEAQKDGYLRNVAIPIVEAYRLYKLKSLSGLRELDLDKRVNLAYDILSGCVSKPLAGACAEWLTRRVTYARVSKLETKS